MLDISWIEVIHNRWIPLSQLHFRVSKYCFQISTKSFIFSSAIVYLRICFKHFEKLHCVHSLETKLKSANFSIICLFDNLVYFSCSFRNLFFFQIIVLLYNNILFDLCNLYFFLDIHLFVDNFEGWANSVVSLIAWKEWSKKYLSVDRSDRDRIIKKYSVSSFLYLFDVTFRNF